MEKTRAFKNFGNNIESLKKTVDGYNKILLEDKAKSIEIDFIHENTNFITKATLVTLCAYIETYLKEVLEILISNYNTFITQHKIPQNLIHWSLNQKLKDTSEVFNFLDKKYRSDGYLSIKLKKKDLDRFISGSPDRTLNLLTMFGINLKDHEFFKKNREFIRGIVEKRNKILHHDDNASDLSPSDILNYIKMIESYISEIEDILKNKMIKS